MKHLPVTQLGPGRRLTGLVREMRARCAYVITDVVAGTVVICSQKLFDAQHYINRMTDDKVSLASLYEGPKLSRLVHRRWRIERHPIDVVTAAFERQRAEYPGAKAVVLMLRSMMTVA